MNRRAQSPADFGDRLNRAGHVRGVQHGHQARVRPQGDPDVVGRNETLAVAVDVGHFHIGRLAQLCQRPQDGVVFADGRHHVFARPDGADNGHVQDIGAVEAEDNFAGVRANQLGHAVAGVFDDAVRFERIAIAAAAAGGADLTQIMVDRVVHRRRLGPGGGGVVEVDAMNV